MHHVDRHPPALRTLTDLPAFITRALLATLLLLGPTIPARAEVVDEFEIADVLIRDLPSPDVLGRACVLMSDVKVRITARRSESGDVDYRVKEIVPTRPESVRFAVTKGEIVEPNARKPRPEKDLAIGDRYDAGRRITFEAKGARVQVLLELEFTDPETAKRPRTLVVTARTIVDGRARHHSITDRVTGFNADKAPTWESKEALLFESDSHLQSAPTEPVRISLPNKAVPTMNPQSDGPYPSRVQVAHSEIEIARR